MTKRRLLTVVLGAALPFFLTVFGSYAVYAYTESGRLAMWIILHSQQMNDDQLARAIGQDPFAVIHRAGLMAKAVSPIVALIVGILVASLEKQIPGRLTALTLTPYFIWDFSMGAFSVVRSPARATLYAAKVLGTNAAYMGLAVIAAIAVSRLLMHVWPSRQDSMLVHP
jgi:hypothetical protein